MKVSCDREYIDDIKRWYSGDWNGFKFIENDKHFTVVCQEPYSGKWVLVYNDPSTHVSGGGITISQSELQIKLLPIIMDILYRLTTPALAGKDVRLWIKY